MKVVKVVGKGQLDNTLPPFMEKDEEEYDVEKSIRTNENDWTEFKVIAARCGSMGSGLHKLIMFYRKFYREEEEKAKTYEGRIAAGFFESDGEKAGLKL